MPALMTFDRDSYRVVAPNPPRYDLWPAAMRSAWQMSSALLRCGPGVRGVGWPETPTVRLAALGEWLGRDRVASHNSAAWVWGAARNPGSPIEISMRPGVRRPLVTPESVHIRETRTTIEDLKSLGEFTVTTPWRTAIDILYSVERFGVVERVACRLLAHLTDGGLQELRGHIDSHRRPHRKLAQIRLASIMSRR